MGRRKKHDPEQDQPIGKESGVVSEPESEQTEDMKSKVQSDYASHPKFAKFKRED